MQVNPIYSHTVPDHLELSDLDMPVQSTQELFLGLEVQLQYQSHQSKLKINKNNNIKIHQIWNKK